ncbi:DUF2512 family protein [Alteribacillus sp. YIM 98480]|uniref:DUF2512 family protein n=1 Tax=Alteribacillus sp. YIM 98480 TaxID=2606599 RepID=UPI00131E1EF9|nr:DUF2512 family protein [Alteribacillus sp. YIM 98480]
MEHVKAIAVKGILTIAALFLVLSLGFGVSFLNVLIIAIVLGAVSYTVGDLYILPKKTNVAATISDLGVTFLVVWLLGMVLTGIAASTMAGAAVISAVIIALAEYFFHLYISKKNIGANNELKTTTSH